MSLRINAEAPNFTAETTQGTIDFHDWIGDGWAILFSHPKDFTPVCTTELGYMAGLKPEFDKRNTKIIGLSRRSGRQPRQVGEGHRGDARPRRQLPDDRRSRAQGRQGLRHAAGGAGTTSEGRTAADNATVRSVFVIGPDKKIKAMLTYPMSTGRNFDEVLRLLDSLPAHRQAHGGDAGELEARRGRDHPALGLRRAGQGEVPQRLEDAEALPAHRRRSRRTEFAGRRSPGAWTSRSAYAHSHARLTMMRTWRSALRMTKTPLPTAGRFRSCPTYRPS